MIGAGLALSGPVNAGKFLRIETFGHNQGVLQDVKLGGDLGEDLTLAYFARDRMTTNYEGETSNFLLQEFSLGYNQLPRVLVQAKLVGEEITPIVGLKYKTELETSPVDGLILYLTSSIEENPSVGALIGTRSDIRDFSFETESILSLNQDGFKGTSRFHAGYKPTDNLQVGLAGEIDYGSGLDQRLGAFVRLNL